MMNYRRILFLCIISLVMVYILGCDWTGAYFTGLKGGTRLVLAPVGVTDQAMSAEFQRRIARIVTMRLNAYGVRLKTVRIIEGGKVEVRLPKLKDLERVKRIILQKGDLEFRYVKHSDKDDSGALSDDHAAAPATREPESLESEVLLDNSMIKDALLRSGSATGMPSLRLYFNDVGSEKLYNVTKKGIGRKMAVVMDGRILITPVIRQAISGGEAMVDGPFSNEELKDIQIVIQSGPYPCKVQVLEESPIVKTR